MKRKLSKPKPPLSRRKASNQITEDKEKTQNSSQDDPVRAGDVRIESTKTAVSSKSKCYRTCHVNKSTHIAGSASSSNEDPNQTSAFDYNSEEEILAKDNEALLRDKRKRESSRDEDRSTSLQCKSRYKKSQQAIDIIKKSDEREKKNRKKRKGRTVTHKSSSSSDEQDFDKPAKKSSCLLVPDIELVKFALPATQGVNKKALLNLKKSKRNNVSSEDQLSDENKVTDKNKSDQKKYPTSVESLGDVDGDDERDDNDDEDGKEDAGKVDDYKPENYNERITRLENKPKDNSAENSVPKLKCPVCSKVFGDSTEQSKIYEHVNSCLDGKGNNDNEITENSSKSSLSMLQDQLVAFEYHQKEIQECKDVFDGDQDGLFFCQICQKNLTKMNSQRRQQHINKCCDEIEKTKQEENEGQGTRGDTKKDVLSCAFCNMEFKSRKSWQAHIKKCAQDNNVPANQLLEIVKQQDQLQQETEAIRRQTEERTDSRGNLETKRMPTQARKKRRVAHDLRNVDEETQLAMALSASMVPPPPPENDDANKPKRKRKKNNEVIPALLLRSKEETQNVIAARAAQVVCSKDDDSDEDSISCTPALAPSSLAEQLLKVEKANANVHIVKGKSNAQVTEKTKATPADNTNQDEGKTTEKDSLHTPDMSASCGDTTLISLADMLASPDMCRSFLSFLDVADEETTTKETNKEKQSPFNVKVGQSAPLWCMASLENRESSINDFYVRGLLPVQSPKQPKKTPRKSSSTREQRLSARSEAKERLNKNAMKKSEEFFDNNHEGSLDKPNKTMSESEITSASQAANVDILLELAGGGGGGGGGGGDDDDDDDDNESHKTQRKSSVDHDDGDDDGEVFPSSGFYLPVGPNNLEKEVHVDHNIPSSLSAFLQDMSKMVGNKLLSDVMIVTKDNENIPAHSFMLASRSEVLADMISNARITTDGLQSYDKPVCLTFNDVEANAVRRILQYVYTASVHVPRPCLDDVIDLAERLKLFELVKACKDSKTSNEKQQEKAGNEEQEEESSSVRCSLSAEELLDALWQGETEGFEANKDNQTQSQEEWGEGFDDEDIEEVRIFQTQAAHRRRCNDDSRQESLEGILSLNEQGDKMEVQEALEGSNETITVNANKEFLLMEVSDGTCEGLQCEKKESNFVCSIIEEDEAQLKECTETSKEKDVLDTTDIPLEKVQPGNDLEEKENEDCEAKEMGLNKKDRIIGIGHKDDGDFGKRDTDKQCGFRKRDVNVDENSDVEKGNTSAERRNPEKRDTYPDEWDKRRENKPSSSSNIQTVDFRDDDGLRSSSDDDMSKNMVDKVDLTEDDSHDEDYETAREAEQDGSKCEPDKYKSIDEGEDDSYRSIVESEDEHVGDVAILDESISLLSDDNECVSPEKIPDNDLIIPETPHPKRKQKRQTTPEDTNVQHPSQVVECLSAVSVSPSRRSDNVSCDNSNENEKDHVSEDEDAFLDKLRSRINAKAKNSGKEKKKRRGREKKTKKSYSRNKKSVKDSSKESEYSSSSSRFQNSFSSSRKHASAINVDVVDLSIENEIEDLTSENASDHFEAGSENEMVDLEGNTHDREKRISNDDDGARFCSSLSPLRMLSPRVESASAHFEALSENQELDLEGNIPDIQKSTSHQDDERSCSSLSPPRMLSPRVEKSSSAHFETFSKNEEIDLEGKSPDRSCSSLSRMLSPRVPSPCYSDFEPESPSVVSPVRSVNQDFAIVESKSYTNVNQSPADTPSARRQLSAQMHSEEVSKPKVDSVTVEEERNIMEIRVSSDSTHLKEHQQAIDTDHESESSDIVTLLPVATSDTHDKTKGTEYEPGEIEETTGKIRETFKATTGVSSSINAKISLFKRLGAAKYGLESTETEGSCDVESIESGLDDTPRKHQRSSPTRSQESTNMKDSNARILDQNEFYDDGGFNCDVGDFGACFDGDDSFMALAGEQVELSEKQDKPDEQEKPDCRVQLSEPRTPALTQRRRTGTPRNRELQDEPIASPITPMPDYDNMTTPDLKNEVKKFGVRPLPKNMMKAKLTEIYHYTHPGASAHTQSKQETSKEKASSRTTKDPSSKERKGQSRTTKAPLRTASASQPTKQPAKKKKGPASQIREGSDSDDDGPLSVRPSSQRPASIKTNKSSKKKLPSPVESGPSTSSRSSSCQPVASSQRLKNNRIESTSSMFDDDKDTKQRGSDDSNDDEKEFGEVSILIDNEPVTASQQVVSDNLENRLLSYVESNQDIYLKVLNYQPIDLMALHELIKCNGIKCRVGELVDFLDNQCITFTTAGQKPRQRRKPRKKR